MGVMRHPLVKEEQRTQGHRFIMFDIKVVDTQNGTLRFSDIYGWPESGEKHQKLELMSSLTLNNSGMGWAVGVPEIIIKIMICNWHVRSP
ncbi:unnamed protein product [Linum trigynum]|uniref:Uncharacterized protein n=1 Tax=Linum trigynum TaxID=586398 RepID=A0AAV2GHV3_9ROSI